MLNPEMDNLNSILEAATARVAAPYFRLNIDGGNPVYRERVYCYELYHQMRLLWPVAGPYLLNGEVDKRAHPLLKESKASRSKPDLLVHIPGNWEGNFAIIEVKHSLALDGIRKDLHTLDVFLRQVDYKKAIYLIYGAQATAHGASIVESVACDFPELRPIEIWLHSEVGVPAVLHTTLCRTASDVNSHSSSGRYTDTSYVQRDP